LRGERGVLAVTFWGSKDSPRFGDLFWGFPFWECGRDDAPGQGLREEAAVPVCPVEVGCLRGAGAGVTFPRRVCEAGDRGEAVWDGLAQSADGGYGGADIFCAFVPLFAFRELRRLLGEEKLYAVLRGRGVADGPESPAAGQ